MSSPPFLCKKLLSEKCFSNYKTKEACMNNKQIVEKVEELTNQVIKDTDIEIFDIEFVKEGPRHFLRIFIDKEGGIFIQDCEKVSRAVDILIEEEDFIKPAYILEVSSPGADRPLKRESDYVKYKGKMVDLKLYKAINGTKEFQGELVGLDKEENCIKIVVDGEEMKFSKSEVAVCRLAVIF